RRLSEKEEVPATAAERREDARVVDALSERDVARLLVGLRRGDIGLAGDGPAGGRPRRARRGGGWGGGGAPGAGSACGAGGLGADVGDRAQHELGSVLLVRVLTGGGRRGPGGEALHSVDAEGSEQRDRQ